MITYDHIASAMQSTLQHATKVTLDPTFPKPLPEHDDAWDKDEVYRWLLATRRMRFTPDTAQWYLENYRQ